MKVSVVFAGKLSAPLLKSLQCVTFSWKTDTDVAAQPRELLFIITAWVSYPQLMQWGASHFLNNHVKRHILAACLRRVKPLSYIKQRNCQKVIKIKLWSCGRRSCGLMSQDSPCSRVHRGKKRGRWSDVAHHAQFWLYQPGGGQLWSGVAASCDRFGAKLCVGLQVWAEKGIKHWTEINLLQCRSLSKCEIKAKCGPSEY